MAKKALKKAAPRKAPARTAAPKAAVPKQTPAPAAPTAPVAVPWSLPAVAKVLQAPSPIEKRRAEDRTAEFGDEADGRIWHKREKGFCTVSRALPLMCTLIRELAKGADAARIYLDLWGRQYEDGFVEIHDEEEIAASCGYHAAHRGIRYWRTGMSELVRLGFIEVKPRNTRKYGFVLLLHPDDAVQRLIRQPRNPVPAWWVALYDRRLRAIGAKRRPVPKDE